MSEPPEAPVPSRTRRELSSSDTPLGTVMRRAVARLRGRDWPRWLLVTLFLAIVAGGQELWHQQLLAEMPEEARAEVRAEAREERNRRQSEAYLAHSRIRELHRLSFPMLLLSATAVVGAAIAFGRRAQDRPPDDAPLAVLGTGLLLAVPGALLFATDTGVLADRDLFMKLVVFGPWTLLLALLLPAIPLAGRLGSFGALHRGARIAWHHRGSALGIIGLASLPLLLGLFLVADVARWFPRPDAAFSRARTAFHWLPFFTISYAFLSVAVEELVAIVDPPRRMAQAFQ